MFHDALLYDKLGDGIVHCKLCAHRCQIQPGGMGICQVRENQDGELKTLVYGNLIALHVDPIEKKPLYHFMPGSRSYSIATPGCNFRCGWCQNWQISQMPKTMAMPNQDRVMPEEIVRQALAASCESIAYTYTEPTIFFEYTYDTAQLAQQAGLKNVYVSNGFMTPEMLKMINPYLDAINIDLKAFRDETYRRLMGGKLGPVLESCRNAKKLGIWLEVTTLIVPGVNDSLDELQALAEFILNELGPETPWHLSRFYPQYQMQDIAPTEEKILHETKNMGESVGLNYIYLGNVIGQSSTYCKHCKVELLARTGYRLRNIALDHAGNCTQCGTQMDGMEVSRFL